MAFVVFGLGALAVATLCFPAFRLLAADRRLAQLAAQRTVHLAFRVFVRFIEGLGLIHVSRFDTGRLRRPGPCLVIANHPTLIDVVLLIACMPQADCVVKRAAWRNPILRRVVEGAGYIPNDGGDELVEACVERLRAGRSLLLFPEGTRSPRGGLGEFHRGAARIALQSGCDVVPVVITCDPPVLVKGQRWYAVADRPAVIGISVGDPVRPVDGAGASAAAALAARQLTGEFRALYERRLGYARR